ncbi:hypothetical protein SDC9_56159 [bioreactor metagenome]|uniref:Uncharacterized protein n=1 Tax=bioreactor metagenome TaxID=1076179 RepID=A0A644X131_9ZZZZ
MIFHNPSLFHAIVQASDFQDASGNSMLTSDGKFDADYLDLMGINVKNDAGDTVLTIDQTGLKFNSAYSPIKYQYSTNNSSWHDVVTSNDKYRRESFDGGTTWGAGYQFVGTDGSDANVPSYIHSTYIGQTEIISPTITGATFNVIGSNDGILFYKNSALLMQMTLNGSDDNNLYIQGARDAVFYLPAGQLYVNVGLGKQKVLTEGDSLNAVFS